MKVILPLTIVLILLILFALYGNLKFPMIIMFSVLVTVPVGGLLALKLTGTNFSVSSGFGFVALMGVAVQTSVILYSFINKLRLEGKDIMTATHEASLLRLRPIMMTALVACIGLLPAAMSTGIGSDSQKPFAIVDRRRPGLAPRAVDLPRAGPVRARRARTTTCSRYEVPEVRGGDRREGAHLLSLRHGDDGAGVQAAVEAAAVVRRRTLIVSVLAIVLIGARRARTRTYTPAAQTPRFFRRVGVAPPCSSSRCARTSPPALTPRGSRAIIAP